MRLNLKTTFLCLALSVNVAYATDFDSDSYESSDKKLSNTKQEIKYTLKPGLYKHYKGMLHRVIGIARHTENQEVVVVYQNLFADYGLRVSSYNVFTGNVIVNGKAVPRFTFIKTLFDVSPPLELGGYQPSIGAESD